MIMKKITDYLPDIDSVKRQLDTVLQSDLSSFVTATNGCRKGVVISRRLAVMAFVFVLIVIAALVFAQTRYSGLLNTALICSAVLWLLVVLVFGRKWFVNEKLLAREMSMALVPILSNVLDRPIVYSYDATHCEETLQLLKDSELMTHANIRIDVDDQYVVYGEQDISFRELVVFQHFTTSAAVSDDAANVESDVKLFKGVFVVMTLPKEHAAETYISTRNDKNGFAHQTFWSDILCFSGVKEVKLEWNEFSRDLYVASSNATVARELLTPHFMQQLHDRWEEPGFAKHRNTRISFKGNKMYMLLPEETVKIATGTTSTQLPAIRRYAWSILRPMWRTLALVDDIS